jgi:hypothetical protein
VGHLNRSPIGGGTARRGATVDGRHRRKAPAQRPSGPSVVRHRAAAAALLVLLVVAGTGCTPSTLPIGARLAADGQLEAFFRSCNETRLRIVLRETDQPISPPTSVRSTGSVPTIRWSGDDEVWEGTVEGDQTSVLIPYVLRPDRTYQLSLVAAATSDSNQLDSEPYVFVASDLDTDGVTTTSYRGPPVPVTPEQFDEATETTCYENGLGPFRWLLLAVGGVCCAILGGLAYSAYQVGRAIGARKPPPPPWTTPDPAVPRDP